MVGATKFTGIVGVVVKGFIDLETVYMFVCTFSGVSKTTFLVLQGFLGL